ncbi:hypothetical protein SAMN05421874_103107 [Nonomuraea maritima]|jgi:hypothetical protein|uniref:Uncharacterized protein n=1 Tax=Nonomuraea maritima TaxID=683260 RepID=A0A1G8WCE5_9ACTN|nr:hypothetical protein [Nonomuraea maritima]SDJ75938.1 hypothetical protein SAMN05421874_103107 [Nonomuraea maritima]
MDVTRTNMPNNGSVHHLVARRGRTSGNLVGDGGRWRLPHGSTAVATPPPSSSGGMSSRPVTSTRAC